MTHMKRSLLVFTSGATQIFFALYVLLKIANINIIQLPSEAMFIPGIIIFLASGYLTASYYFGDKKNNSALYDEYTAIRYYKLGAIGYAINGNCIFCLADIWRPIGMFFYWRFQRGTQWVKTIKTF